MSEKRRGLSDTPDVMGRSGAANRAHYAKPEVKAQSAKQSRALHTRPEYREKLLEGAQKFIERYWSDPKERARRAKIARTGIIASWADPAKKADRVKRAVESNRVLRLARKSHATGIPAEYQDAYERTAAVMGEKEARRQVLAQAEKDKRDALLAKAGQEKKD